MTKAPTAGPGELTVTLTDKADEATRARVLQGLNAEGPPGFGPAEPLAVLLHEAEDRLVGGLIGRTFWEWLAIELLWIAPAHRGAGHGRRLVAIAEDEARRRGCHHARVNTYSFQAPGFYEKCGYARFAALDGFAQGQQLLSYAKSLS
ncbi:MAG: GNAT family N-acetyltransferase [Geminicoccaceae bacterium]